MNRLLQMDDLEQELLIEARRGQGLAMVSLWWVRMIVAGPMRCSGGCLEVWVFKLQAAAVARRKVWRVERHGVWLTGIHNTF